MFPESYFSKVKATAAERRWNRKQVTSIPPSGTPMSFSTTIPKAELEELNAGRQTVSVVGSVTYNDGFPDTTDQYWPVCFTTRFEEKKKDAIWSPCDATAALPIAEKADGYPQHEDESKYP